MIDEGDFGATGGMKIPDDALVQNPSKSES
jgi:hypothetical protein